MEHPFAQYVRALGKGKTGSRSLTRGEASLAMQMILRGEAEPQQVGAFLMLLRVKEESAEELAGFVDACRDYFNPGGLRSIAVDIDWSSYAGKRKQPHWYLLAALLLAQNGHSVFMHGARGHTAGRVYSEDILGELGLVACREPAQVAQQLARHNFAFMPLSALCQPLQQLIDLRQLFGLRSPVHTLCRLLNPLSATTTMQSVFHPAYAKTHHRAAMLLGEQNAVVFKGDAGEFEYRPHARLTLDVLRAGQPETLQIPRRCDAPADALPSTAALRELWSTGKASGYAANAVIGTAAIVLYVHGSAHSIDESFAKAEAMWDARRDSLPGLDS